MKKSIERISGDTEGVTYDFPVLTMAGNSAEAPSAYIQAALHGDELPGVVAIDALMPLLRTAQAEGRIKGSLTIVPWANPIGRSQRVSGEVQGRFDLGTRTNFNRDFPLLPDPHATPPNQGRTVDERLKHRLLSLSMGHDIVLDLHCDDEGVAYLYVPAQLWPAMADCAAAMGVEAVVLWSGSSGASFDEASIHPHLQLPPEKAGLDKRVVTTVEYRGIADVERGHATSDAAGLYRLLVARGVVEDKTLAAPGAFAGLVAPIGNIEMISTDRAGAVLFDVRPGDRVKAGDRLATIVHTPGEAGGALELFAPQAGFVLTRRAQRSARVGDDLIKLIGEGPSATAKAGALEA